MTEKVRISEDVFVHNGKSDECEFGAEHVEDTAVVPDGVEAVVHLGARLELLVVALHAGDLDLHERTRDASARLHDVSGADNLQRNTRMKEGMVNDTLNTKIHRLLGVKQNIFT